MALKLRRGTDLERQSVIFDEGELIYTTDTKTLWVGDGQTIGGIRVGGNVDESPISLTQNLDLNSFDIVGNGDIDITGAVIANSFVGDGSGLTNLFVSFDPGQEYDISIRGNLRGVDSSLVFDYQTNSINANLSGDGSNITNLSLNQLGDVNTQQSVSGDILTNSNGFWVGSNINNIIDGNSLAVNIIGSDSSVIVDYANSRINGTLTGNVNYPSGMTLIDNSSGIIYPNEIDGGTVESKTNFVFVGTVEKNSIEFELRNTSTDLSSSVADRGSIFFSRNDTNGKVYETLMGAGRGGFYVSMDDGSTTFPQSGTIIFTKEGRLGIGTYTPGHTLDVAGGVAASGYIQFGSYTTTGRNSLTPANGMVIYNTTANRFQGYQNGSWINLDNGSAA